MRTSRIFVAEQLHEHSRVPLDDDARRHLLKVLRLKTGDPLVLFDGSGRDFAARLHDVGKQLCTADVLEVIHQEPQPALLISLAIGISRGERMDFSIQKAVELGVSSITPLFTERSMVHLKGERLHKRHDHWYGVIRHACEQSGRSRLPQLHRAQSLADWLETFQGNGVLLDHRATTPLVNLDTPGDKLALLVGPEGGLSPQERDFALRSGLRSARMGPRVLRTETAPLAALSVIQALWGDFRE